MGKPEIYSFSRLGSFETCEASFKYKYIDKKDEIDNFWGQLGTLCHELIEDIEKGKISRENADTDFHRRWSEMTCDAPYKSIANNAYNGLVNYFKNYRGFATNNLVIEEEMYVKFDDFWLRGYIDMYGFDNDNEIVMIDHKIANPNGASWDMNKKMRQLYLYSSYIFIKFGKFPKKLIFNFIKDNSYHIEEFRFGAFQEAVEWMKGTVRDIRAARDDKDYLYNANISDFFCGNVCGFRTECTFWNSKQLKKLKERIK